MAACSAIRLVTLVGTSERSEIAPNQATGQLVVDTISTSVSAGGTLESGATVGVLPEIAAPRRTSQFVEKGFVTTHMECVAIALGTVRSVIELEVALLTRAAQ